MLIHSTTKYIKVPDLENLSLMGIALPYIAIEKDDYLENVQNEINKRFCFAKIIIVTGGTFTDAVNEIADVAYNDNMTYFVPINDDTRFISPNWASTGMLLVQH